MLSSPDALTPYLPEDPSGLLDERAVAVLRRADALGALVPAELRDQVVELAREMNGYYSNLIEEHSTFPLSIARALDEDLSRDPAKRSLQLEAIAHVEVQRLVAERLAGDRAAAPTSADFLRWIHAEFYRRMPAAFRVVRSAADEVDEVVPGEAEDARAVSVTRVRPHGAPGAVTAVNERLGSRPPNRREPPPLAPQGGRSASRSGTGGAPTREPASRCRPA